MKEYLEPIRGAAAVCALLCPGEDSWEQIRVATALSKFIGWKVIIALDSSSMSLTHDVKSMLPLYKNGTIVLPFDLSKLQPGAVEELANQFNRLNIRALWFGLGANQDRKDRFAAFRPNAIVIKNPDNRTTASEMFYDLIRSQCDPFTNYDPKIRDVLELLFRSPFGGDSVTNTLKKLLACDAVYSS
jgi:hypothetical protein